MQHGHGLLKWEVETYVLLIVYTFTQGTHFLDELG